MYEALIIIKYKLHILYLIGLISMIRIFEHTLLSILIW